MKRCSQCGREYDASMMFCLDDGAELLYGPASIDGPATAILPPPDAPTRAQIHTTEAEPQSKLGNASERQSLSAHRAAEPQTRQAAEPQKHRAANPLIALAIAIAVLLTAGFFGYRYLNSGGGQITSIAVLPFENRSGSADADYLSDGLAESLIYRLTQLPGLKVSPTN